MGQSWQIMSPSACESLSSCGKLGEYLFNGSPRALVMQFAVPILPSGQDLHELLYKEKAKQQESLLSVDSQHIKHEKEKHLSNPSVEQHQEKKKFKSSNTSELEQTRAHLPTFLSLPVELHYLIFDKLDNKDKFSISFTNQYFWSIGRKYVLGFFCHLLAPWAGQTIICVGSYLKAGDYPPGISTEHKEEIQQAVEYSRQSASRCRHIENCIDRDDLGPQFLYCILFSKQETFRDAPEPIKPQISYLLSDFSRYYPDDQSWILRNLTTREYVRSEAIALKPEYIHGPVIDVLGFGEVILSRVCWSTNLSAAVRYKGGLHRGVWAGHRFDITTLARHERGTRKEGWKDVSEEVAIEIASIWESEYGSDWRQIVCQKDCPEAPI